MKYVIRGEKEFEKPAEVWLEMMSEGPTWRMRDKSGVEWNIAQLRKDGMLYLITCIHPSSGLKVDDRGRIVVE